jgi:hypothetical protein
VPHFKVVAEFIDKKSGKRLKPGDTVDASGDRVERLKKAGVIEREISMPVNKTNIDPSFVPQHLGGDLYLLPNGDKVQGKDEAIKAIFALEEEVDAEEEKPRKSAGKNNKKKGRKAGK